MHTEEEDLHSPIVVSMVVVRFLILALDFWVLFLFTKASLFFMIVKAERLKIENDRMSKCDACLSLWTLIMIVIYTMTLICRALFAPLPLLSERNLGD